MKDGIRFVDSDMHIMEPPDLFDRYLDPKFKAPGQRAGGSRRPAQSRPGRPDRHRRAADLGHGPAAVPQARPARPAPRAPSSCRDRGSSTRAAWTSPSSATTTPKPRSWAWRWRGSTSRCSTPPPASPSSRRDNIGSPALPGPLPGLQQLDPRVLPVQPRPAEVRGHAARARRAPGLPGAGAVRAGAGRRRVVHPAESRERPLLALELLGSALQHPRRAERDLGLPRGRERRLLPHGRRCTGRTASTATWPATGSRCSRR